MIDGLTHFRYIFKGTLKGDLCKIGNTGYLCSTFRRDDIIQIQSHAPILLYYCNRDACGRRDGEWGCGIGMGNEAE